LQSRPETFDGTLLVSDATLWSSTSGGADSLRQLWTNVIEKIACENLIQIQQKLLCAVTPM
jgi:hypothetical protein